MSSDFYKRTKELFEEFQKRELQYLNADIAAKSNFQVTNMPVHEYLETLNRKEKESEEDYLVLMRHMEQLDHRTESIKEKLQKLETLRISMSSSKASVSAWPYSANSNDEKSFYNFTSSSSVLRTDHPLNDTYLQPSQFVLSKEKAVECASTQTNVMFCENCQFPITLFTERRQDILSINNSSNAAPPPIKNASLSSQVVAEETAFKSNLLQPSIPHNDETKLNANKVEKLEESINMQNLSKITEEASFENESSLDQTMSADIAQPASLNIKSSDHQIISTTALANTASDKQPKTDIIIKTDHAESVKDVRVPVNNSDSEKVTVNNSNKKELDSNPCSDIVPEALNQSVINRDPDLTANIVIDDLSTLSVNQSVSQICSEGEISASKIDTEKSALNQDGLSDRRSESPISFGGAPSPSLHSENISAVSDSDSYDEKGGLKESAAYQALLGKVPVTKKIQKTTAYESESEDEVERALANATRKSSHVPSAAAVQEPKPNGSQKNDVEEPKAKSEPRKSISLSKPQQLSKTTRKVLGMDTSSGSEGEIKISAKPNQKIEEDSDEFDFYDINYNEVVVIVFLHITYSKLHIIIYKFSK